MKPLTYLGTLGLAELLMVLAIAVAAVALLVAAVRKWVYARDAVLAALALPFMFGLVLALAGCTPPAGPTIIIGGDTIINGGSSADTRGPGAGTSKGPVVRVEIKGIVGGEHCGSGATPANESHTLGVGCYLDITVNPIDANGVVILDTNVAGLAPDYFQQRGDSPAASFTLSAGNPYNGRITGTARGTIILAAAVKGVPSGDVTFTIK
jgi:hypothetical protein